VERRLGPIFNMIVDTYDNIKFVQGPAERLVEKVDIKPGQRVLDIACGTGWATMAAAKAACDTGKVIGIDIAEKMLEVARKKTESAGLLNIEYRMGDAEALEFDEGSFDVAICALSIFLFSDIPKALQEWRRVLKKGGKVAFSSFGANFMRPAYGLFMERLERYDGIKIPSQQIAARTGTPEKCRALLERVGFKDVEIATEQMGGYVKDIQDYWTEVTSTIMRARLMRLSPAALEKFKEEHLAEIAAMCTDKGLWIDIPTLFIIATK
jgi:arsenite methyltransferase